MRSRFNQWRRVARAAALLPILAAPAAAQAPILTAAKITADTSPPVVDGILDEAVWTQATPAGDFVQSRPDHGAPATHPTVVRVLVGDDAVFVGARMYDPRPDSIIARLARRDDWVVSDRFLVGFDSYNDRRTAFAFGVNAAGTQYDWLVFEDTKEDPNWDAVWTSATRVDSLGWTAELRIPLSQLRIASRGNGADDSWGVNFQRYLARRLEFNFWANLPPDLSRYVSSFGTLRVPRGTGDGSSLELRPYVVARATRAPGSGADPFYRKSEYDGRVGLDLRYALTPSLSLNATTNPDFGQVEADPSVVNLTAFETFLPEKRPFFQEGSDIFRFPLGFGGGSEQLFYTRRIGRRPTVAAVPGAAFADVPGATSIHGAVKLSGRVGRNWSVGLLNATTARETGLFATRAGGENAVVVEPLTNYAMARVQRTLDEGESAVGMVFTSLHRDLPSSGPTRLLPARALATGLDLRHRIGNGDHELTGWFLGSRVSGSAEAMALLQADPVHNFRRPDADHLRFDPTRTSVAGAAAQLRLARLSGAWRWAVSGEARSSGFDVNGTGYQVEADRVKALAHLTYEDIDAGPHFRRWQVDANHWLGWTLGGERVSAGGNLVATADFTNRWTVVAGVGHELSNLSTSALRGGPALRLPSETSAMFAVFNDPASPMHWGLRGSFAGEHGTDGRRISLSPALITQPSNRLRVTLAPTLSVHRGSSQYVWTATLADQPAYVLGSLDQEVVSLVTRLNYTIDSDLSVQLYAQPFLGSVRFDDYHLVDDPRARDAERRIRRLPTLGDGPILGGDPDGDGQADFALPRSEFRVGEFRSNVVVRWQYGHGSSVFLVWSQDRSDFDLDAGLDVGGDLGNLLDVRPRNVVLLKVEHFLSW